MLSMTWWQMSALAGTMMYLQPTSKNHLFGEFVWKNTHSVNANHTTLPRRTSCCWVTSTQAVVMCPGLTGSRSASSLTRLSIGWSLMRPTLPCRKLSALTTGRQIVAGRSHVCTQTLNSNHLSVFAGLWSLRTWWEEWWKIVRRSITTWRTWISNKIW